MKSPVAAIVWEIWSRDRGGFVCALGAVPLCAIVYAGARETIRRSDSLMLLSFFPLGLSLIVLLRACAYTDAGGRADAAGFPKRLFYLPISTSKLVSVPLLFGSACVALAWIGWAALVFRPLGVAMDIVWPAALLGCLTVAYQAVLWLLAEVRIIRLVVLACGGTAILALVVIKYSGTFSDWTLLLNCGLVVGGAAAYACALVGVHHQRHGGISLTKRLRTFAGQIEQSAAIRIIKHQRPFRSIHAAQCWYEWRRNGRVLPMIAAATLLFGFVSRDNGMDKLMWCVGVPLALAALLGKVFVKPGPWSFQLPTFLALRPISSGQVVSANLSTAARSAAVTWLCFLLLAPSIILLRCNTANLKAAWQHLGNAQSPVMRIGYLAMIGMAIVFWTWVLMISSLHTGLWGRPWAYYLSIAWSFAGAPCLFFVLIWAVLPLFPFLHAENPDVMMRWAPQIGWVLAGLFLLKVWLAAFAARSGLQRGLITRHGVIGYLLVWLCGTGLAVGLALMVFATGELGELYSHTWVRPYLVAIAILQVPLARIALCPGAVRRARVQ